MIKINKEAFDDTIDFFSTLFGKEFVDEMLSRFLIIGGAFVAALLVIGVVSAWKSIAGKKISKVVLALSEHPTDEQADLFFTSIRKVSAFGKFLTKHGKGFSNLTKSECRIIFNQTILASEKISLENKKKIRESMMTFGCSGLTDE